MKRWRVSFNDGTVKRVLTTDGEYTLGAIRVAYVRAQDELGAWLRARELWKQKNGEEP